MGLLVLAVSDLILQFKEKRISLILERICSDKYDHDENFWKKCPLIRITHTNSQESEILPKPMRNTCDRNFDLISLQAEE